MHGKTTIKVTVLTTATDEILCAVAQLVGKEAKLKHKT
jgi:hypothetical protein